MWRGVNVREHEKWGGKSYVHKRKVFLKWTSHWQVMDKICMDTWMNGWMLLCMSVETWNEINGALWLPFFTRCTSSDFLFIRGFPSEPNHERNYFDLQHSRSLKAKSHQYFSSSFFSSFSTKLVSSNPSSLKTLSLPTFKSSCSCSCSCSLNGASDSKTLLFLTLRSSFPRPTSRKIRSPDVPLPRCE